MLWRSDFRRQGTTLRRAPEITFPVRKPVVGAFAKSNHLILTGRDAAGDFATCTNDLPLPDPALGKYGEHTIARVAKPLRDTA